jgi:hypothetical protein
MIVQERSPALRRTTARRDAAAAGSRMREHVHSRAETVLSASNGYFS